MNDMTKTKTQLINELAELRQLVAQLETTVENCEHAKIEREHLLRSEREQRLLAETLRKVTLALTAQTNHTAVLDEILRQVQRVVPCKIANIALLQNDHLKIVRWQGYEQVHADKFVPALVQPLADFPLDREAIQLQTPLVIPDTHQEPLWVILDETAWIRSHLAVPICTRDSVLGLLRLDADLPHRFSARDAEQLQLLANAAAIALENACLYDQVQQELGERRKIEEALQNSIQQMRIAYEQAIIYARELKEEVARHRQTRDVIEQLRSQNELILNAAGEGIFGLDLQGKHTFVNPAAAKILEYEIEELIGQPSHQIWHHTKPDGSLYPEEECPIYAAYQDRIIHRGDDEFFWRKDGTSFPVEYVSTPILETGKIVGAVVVFRDITNRKHLEEQYRQAQKMEAVGRLAGGIAHDFNNLMTVITGHVEFLLEQLPEPDNPLRKEVEEIQQASERAIALTRQLLTFSRRQPVQLRVLNLNKIITELETMLLRLIGEDIVLKTRLDPELGLVQIDPGQFNQILMNLVVNAKDAMPHGGTLTIKTTNVDLGETDIDQNPELTPGRYVSIAVTDTGIGMDAEIQSQIFEPFFTTKAIGKGTGLGLSVVYAIVNKSNGHISVSSKPGQGTAFKIYLPRLEATAEVAQPTQPVQVTGTFHARFANILLVEDEPAVRLVISRYLQKNGFTVLIANDPDEALTLCQQHEEQIDLLLTDVVMPQMSGYELANRLKKACPDMKVLYVSGYSDEELGQYGETYTKATLIQKPFSSEALIHKVREILSES
jgi:two-component system cell cycle sensor histidine kinase/response regulator CckA